MCDDIAIQLGPKRGMMVQERQGRLENTQGLTDSITRLIEDEKRNEDLAQHVRECTGIGLCSSRVS